MKTIIYREDGMYKKQIATKDLIYGIILIIIASLGLTLNTKFILKLFMYIIPLLLLIYAFSLYKTAFSFRKNNNIFISTLIQAITITLSSLYIILFPIESLNYFIIIIGIIILINSISKLLIYKNNYISIAPIILGILCLFFSQEIINMFYNLFLIILLALGIYKVIDYIQKTKK